MTRKSITKLLIAAVSSFVLVALAMPAQAGRGGSFGKINNAVRNGSADSIVAELERAEKLPCAQCIDLVISLTEDARYEVRQAAGWWLTKRPGVASVLRDSAEATLATTTDSVEARNAADLLGTFERPSAIPTLTAAISRTDLSADARASVAKAIGDIGHDAGVPALEIALADSDANVRYQAVGAWAKIRHMNSAAPVVALVRDTDLTVRRAAISVVGKFADASARSALEDLVLNDEDPAVRRNAAWSLGRIGNDASRAVLQQAADDSSPLVRNTAKNAIRAL